MIALLTLVVLIGWALNRNHRREAWPFRSGIAPNDVADRDAERLADDLRAVDHQCQEQLPDLPPSLPRWSINWSARRGAAILQARAKTEPGRVSTRRTKDRSELEME